MQRSLLKCWLFLFWMTRIEGVEKIWKPDDSLVNQRTMKIILDSCYKDESSSKPIVIIGDFMESIEKSSVIKLNESYKSNERAQYSRLSGKISYVASKIILIEDSPKKLESDLRLLQSTRWWNHMALFFIIEKNAKTCENYIEILLTTWRMDILNSIYICTESNNEAALYTFNPMANYAPLPWKRREVRPEHLHMFHQFFDSNIVCENLHYDKTKILDAYQITVIQHGNAFTSLIPQRMYFTEFKEHLRFAPEYVLLWGLFTSWNVTARIERVESLNDMIKRFQKCTAEMSLTFFALVPDARNLIPTYFYDGFIAIGKLHQKVSPLTEICQLWSFTVSMAATATLGILLIILTIQNHNFLIAVLDLIRLLTCTSISADNRSHKFRIYFTSVLIFIVIINGVFQGFIVTFLIKEKSVSHPRTLDELGELGYKIYVPFAYAALLNELCPKCDIKEATTINCISYARNKPHHACLLAQILYNRESDAHELDIVKEPVLRLPVFFLIRQNWPLRNRVIKRFSRIFESGLQNFWMTAATKRNRFENQMQKAERFAPRYKPFTLNELTFAFQMLGLGLSISTIVFFIELIVGNWRKCRKIKLTALGRLNRCCNKNG